MARTRKISSLRITEVPELLMCVTEVSSLDDTLTPGIYAYTASTAGLPSEGMVDKYGLVIVWGRYTTGAYQLILCQGGTLYFRAYGGGKWMAWRSLPMATVLS